MALPATEPFTGTGALSGSWTQVGFSLQLVTRVTDQGKASALDGSHDVQAYWTGDTFSNDQYSQVTLAGGLHSGANYAQVLVRASGTGATATMYLVVTDGGSGAGHTELYKVTASETYSLLQTIATTWTTGDVMRLEVTGTTLQVKKNGVQVGSDQVDSAIASGSAGIGLYNSITFGNVVVLDDWEGGDVSAGGGRTTKNAHPSGLGMQHGMGMTLPNGGRYVY